MFTLQWRLTIVTFMAVPLIIAASKVYGDYYKKLTTLVQDAQVRAAAQKWVFYSLFMQALCCNLSPEMTWINTCKSKRRATYET